MALTLLNVVCVTLAQAEKLEIWLFEFDLLHDECAYSVGKFHIVNRESAETLAELTRRGSTQKQMYLFSWPRGLKPLLLACKDKPSIAKIHAVMLLTGIFYTGNSTSQLILTSYIRVGDINSARKVFDELSHRGVDAWNAMIIAYSRKNYPVEVLKLYNRMTLEGGKPDSSTFTVTLKACASLSDLEIGEAIRGRAVDCGYEHDVFVQSSVLNLYAKCGNMDNAMKMFDKMQIRDIVSWTTMVTGFAQSCQGREALDIYRRMQKEGIEGDRVVMLGLIQACANVGVPKIGLSLHGYMIRKGLPMDVIVQTSLVDMYAKNGLLDLAFRVFKKIVHKNVISWSTLISGLAQNGFAGDALRLLVEMQSFRYQPDSVSLVSALLACSQVGNLKMGRSIHGYIVRRLDFGTVSSTAVIDMYSKCGVLYCARALFEEIGCRDLISWNAMISSYGIHGHGKEALSLFLQMIETNLKPNHATFASLLSAFSHSGLVEEGQYWFDVMISEFRIQPSEKHYACMIDLLARAGKVEEAHKLIDSMTSEPGLTIWVALLSGCLNYGKLLIGEIAAKKVLELTPDDPGIYALVSNFFATARKWDEVAVVRKVMRKSGTKKIPGYSEVEVNGKLQAFLMEDKSHHQYEEILGLLEVLNYDMRAKGYIPQTGFFLHDLEK